MHTFTHTLMDLSAGGLYCGSVHKCEEWRCDGLNLNMGDIMLVCTMAEKVHKGRDAARVQQVRVFLRKCSVSSERRSST